MDVIILAGGEGKRIKALAKKKSKILLKINKKTIIERQINHLKKINKKIYISLKKDDLKIKKSLNKIKNIKFQFLEETKKLGTAGCLESLTKYNLKDLMVVYGDTLFNIDLKTFINFHRRQKSQLTLFCHPNNHPQDSDLIELDKFSKVKKFYRKPHGLNISGNLSLAGIYIINKNLLKLLKKNSYQDFSKNFLPKILKKNYKVYGYRSREYIKDVGTPKRIKEARKDFLNIKYKKGNLKAKIPAIFLDKDGVINVDKYNYKYQKPFNFIEGCFDAIRKINQKGFLSIIVTNQSAVAKGYISLENLKKDFKKLEKIMGTNKCYVDDIYYCPCHPQKGFKGEITKFKKECNWRKPNNGMIVHAIKKHNIDIKKSFMIGDTLKDQLAAKKTNIKFLKVGNNNVQNSKLNFKNLSSAVDYIFKN